MLEHECRRLGYDTAKLLTSENLKEVATRSHFDGSEENLLAAIGYGGVLVSTVMVKLIELYKMPRKRIRPRICPSFLRNLNRGYPNPIKEVMASSSRVKMISW